MELNRTRTCVCITAIVGIVCGTTQAEWRNALKPAGEPAGQVTVVQAGKASCAIQLPAQPTSQERKAAADLQQWIREMTGATLEIASGGATAPCGIVIRTDLSLGDEGYAIAVENGGISLSGGRTRGVINAVYALLEEDLGCRFYTNESIRLPKAATLVIAPVARRYIPQLKLRDPFYACAFDPVWSLRNRTNAPSAAVPEEYGGHVDYDVMFVHTIKQFVPPDKYFKEHPEYFAQREDGKRSMNQLCATEPGVAKVAIEHVRRLLKNKPNTEIISISKEDIVEVCHCQRCTKLRTDEGSDIANQLFLVNQVAEAIEKEYPNVTIDTLAYLETIEVPKTVRPRKNVAIRLCNDNPGSWVHPFTPAEQCDVAKIARAWSAAHNRIYVWDYNVNFSHYLAPMPNLDVIAANIRFWVSNHAEGVMLQGGYQGPAEQDELKSWVAGKILWDPSRDEKALAQDFIWGHYGKAAPALAEYDALLNNMRVEYAKEMVSPAGGLRYSMAAPFFTKAFVTNATEIFARAKELAKGDEVLTRRVERAQLPILYVQCVRGPDFVGDDYAQVVAEFERIARREKVQYLYEGPTDLEAKLAKYKSLIGKTTIVLNGLSSYQIVTPSKASPAVEYAAKELQSFLSQMSGVRLPVVSEAKAGDTPSLLLGPCDKTQKAGLPSKAAKLREDGVMIKTLGKDIALLGQNERGHLYSVYVLLEKYFGVRFLAWDYTVVPKRADLILPDLDYSYSPPFMYRETLYFDSFPKEIATRQRLNGPFTKCDASVGGKIEFFPYVHSFNNLIPEKEYFKDHPEYFGLQGGKRVAGPINAQLCLTNPDVLRLAKAKVLKWIDENPNIPIFDVSQNDGGGPCECDKCMAIVKEEGSQHGPIMRFVNAIADVVAEKHPDKWIETLAYSYAITPPAITKPRDNVIIRLCHVGCYFHGFEQCKMGAEFASLVGQWGKLTRRIFIWHYATNFGHYLAPNPNLNSLAKDIKFYGLHNVNGVMVQGNYQGPGGELAELRQYLSAQLIWDPSQDPMQIRNEFCRGYYGKAAGDVLEFLRLMDTTSQESMHAFANWNPTTTVFARFAQDALTILQKARKAANDPAVRNRVGKLMLPFWYMMLTNQDKYGLTNKDAAAMWAQAKKVVVDNKITFIREDGSAKGNAEAWVFEMDGRFGPTPKDMVLDLGKINLAKIMYCTDWRTSNVARNGRLLRSILQHPDGRNNGEATYEITLPALPQDGKLVMKFATVINNQTQDGVRFAVLVNGNELWNETKTTFISPEQAPAQTTHDNIQPKVEPFTDHSLDLSKYAGQTIKLTLRVNARANNIYDWANWVEPRIVIVKVAAARSAD